jgi:hypothetical protein
MSYTPLFPYNKEQIIINSDRVSINSKQDSIFLFADKAISLSSNEGIHINTNKEVIINSQKTYLGLNATEPLVLGNKFTTLMEILLTNLENVGEQLFVATDSNGNPIPSVQSGGNSLIKSVKRVKKLLKSINSKRNFTI